MTAAKAIRHGMALALASAVALGGCGSSGAGRDVVADSQADATEMGPELDGTDSHGLDGAESATPSDFAPSDLPPAEAGSEIPDGASTADSTTDLPIDAVDISTPDAACSPPDLPTCSETACGAVSDLADEDGLKAFLGAAPWHENGAWCAVSNEVRLAGPIEIAAADIVAPDWCEQPPCAPVFQLLTTVPGVTCTESMPALTKFCPKIRIEQAQFRVRPGRWVSEGFASSVVPVLGIVGPCEAPCAANEATCPNHTCYPKPVADYSPMHCLMCRGGDDRECACWGEHGPVAEGTVCGWVQGDVALNGHCKCGTCTSP